MPERLPSRLGISPASAWESARTEWLDALADLRKAGKAALVLAGERQPAHGACPGLRHEPGPGFIGNTVSLDRAGDPGSGATLGELVRELNSGKVDILVVLDGNPVYTAPADLELGAAMQKARQSVYLGDYPDETAALATLVCPGRALHGDVGRCSSLRWHDQPGPASDRAPLRGKIPS